MTLENCFPNIQSQSIYNTRRAKIEVKEIVPYCYPSVIDVNFRSIALENRNLIPLKTPQTLFPSK